MDGTITTRGPSFSPTFYAGPLANRTQMNAENKEKNSASSALFAVNLLILWGADGLVGAASHHKDVAHVRAVEIVTNGRSHKVYQPVTIHIPQRQGIDA